MEYLPRLPVDQIMSYLEVPDLLACSLVNSGWRAVINDDRLWKKVCYKQSNKPTIEYVQAVTPRISPEFEEPESYHKRLEPLCHWRVVYMKLQHVNWNWRRAKHETYSVTDLAYNHFDLKIENDLLVANVNDNQCEVWNIRGIPRKQETVICALKNTRCKCMIHLCGDRLVIVQDTLLQIYHRVEKRFSCRYRRLFNQPESDSETIPGSLTVDEWYNETVKRRPTHLQAFNVSKYFIGLALNGTFENASFHVWDSSVGVKLKEEVVKNISVDVKEPIHNVKFCPPKTEQGKILVCVQHVRQSGNFGDDIYFSVLYIYDLLTLTFRKLRVLRPHVPWIYYEDNLILTIGYSQAKLSIYNSTSGERLASKRYEGIINPESVQVHGNHIGFTTGGDLVVLSIKDFGLEFTTGIVKFSSNLFGFDFVFLDWDLVLISRWDKVNKIEVWSVKEKCFLSTLHASGLMFPCNNSAKFFVWNEMITTIYMLQFW
ncbi:uncharacterized protein LOC129002368 [Macrosteles quadrilineatus]|uniref:uncharacterized protein LOC129002368 n=1 Tax=Macrosteles quadrilineatus TaxID=74068 RepID=UPI0023E09F41|nr:uncharacterized protein LOC129002368 [Macrosteles quadrilineatus]XP_054286087.1 uncharacterized protein LOC129002368 [Macrosteles quadrilineatus]